eukprot:CAMPEP_0114646446 /NCGR_PEP_ID=MMETSP0191-20121206/5180_1 /TAXON_ID=126664 /ORGANISM="Sorites sp." /LENGTH=198 /DNA_ID=CAMNT_0001859325 /DNA_START=102 /DNA_END=696 /DNA_ORIENTATION=-
MSTCIQIIEGMVPGINRLALKGHMEQFGQVDLVHMGNRQNPEEEPPKVRFSTPEAAQRALDAINAGQVVIDGMLLKAQYMQGKGRGRGAPPTATERNLEVTSRDLFLERERAKRKHGTGNEARKEAEAAIEADAGGSGPAAADRAAVGRAAAEAGGEKGDAVGCQTQRLGTAPQSRSAEPRSGRSERCSDEKIQGLTC